MKRFELTNKAKEDLKGIARYTQNHWGRKQRLRYLKQLDLAFIQLAKSPDMAADCNDIKSGYRYIPCGSHLIFYKSLNQNDIVIVRVLHKRMALEHWL
jgi:toxin ParE1/3/4